MRAAVFIVVGLQAAIVVAAIVIAATTRSDAAGEGMAIAYAVIAGAGFVVLPLPALMIALFTRQQWLALALSVLGACVLIALLAVL